VQYREHSKSIPESQPGNAKRRYDYEDAHDEQRALIGRTAAEQKRSESMPLDYPQGKDIFLQRLNLKIIRLYGDI